MKRVLKWILIVVLSAIGLLVILGLSVWLNGQSRLNQSYYVEGHDLTVAEAGSEVLARGKHLVDISHCKGCHGDALEGKILVDDASFGIIAAPNLTAGEGGIDSSYTDLDWERAIRHGVASDRRMLIAMPSELFNRYGDEDLTALIRYIQSVPPVDHFVPERAVGPMAKLLIGSDQFVPSVLQIDHTQPHEAAPVPGPTIEYGSYLVKIAACQECHGAALTGQTVEGPPKGPDITRTGALGSWDLDDFSRALRIGTTPDGRVLDPEVMPWPGLVGMSDDEVSAIWNYLQSL